jgi:hypothetical protein
MSAPYVLLAFAVKEINNKAVLLHSAWFGSYRGASLAATSHFGHFIAGATKFEIVSNFEESKKISFSHCIFISLASSIASFSNPAKTPPSLASRTVGPLPSQITATRISGLFS